jgi:multiple antibiotic resistance protein
MDFLQELGIGIAALLAITNPFGNLPVFISMTNDLTEHQRSRLFRQIVYVAVIIVVIFTLIGSLIMTYLFQVNLSELRVAGGLILMVMGLKNLLFPQEVRKHDINDYNVSDDEASQRIVPMGFPMLVGPGTLATVIILEQTHGGLQVYGAIFLTFAFIFILLQCSKYIERLVGKLSMSVISRIMQVFIMAMGVKMLMIGVKDIFGL